MFGVGGDWSAFLGGVVAATGVVDAVGVVGVALLPTVVCTSRCNGWLVVIVNIYI